MTDPWLKPLHRLILDPVLDFVCGVAFQLALDGFPKTFVAVLRLAVSLKHPDPVRFSVYPLTIEAFNELTETAENLTEGSK